ncbi:hypothetical protein BG015_000271 [Linnemannia schmuckeri]|uniref:F-box domain-containing protein n=1 Tax=Linnemannia schmuckeri TaxID=64567 RepID=A0A9P5S6N5_9FUNG|nr:hypothetical protein BG015_000271 [Linnemannia schmuckeri]
MEPATKRFFDMPELIAHLTQHLDCTEISSLMQTSRRMHELCTPAHYHNVERCFIPARVNSTESIQAFAKNVHHIRAIVLWRFEIAYYTNCVFAFQDLKATPSSLSTAIAHPFLRRPLWPAPTDLLISKMTMPPMTLLTKLNLSFDMSDSCEDCPYDLPSYRNPKAVITQAC